MARRQKSQGGRYLPPLTRVLIVHREGIAWLEPHEITVEAVGQKALGLSALPIAWTLPFFAISSQLLVEFLVHGPGIVDAWLASTRAAMDAIGFRDMDRVLVRSSGCSEDMNLRGALHTVDGEAHSIGTALVECLTRLAKEATSKTDHIPLLVQKACSPLRSRGHLSNERRCYEEHRDWIGEIESVDPDASAAFQINIRHWRERVTPNTSAPLSCTLTSWISEVLKAPAEWAYGCGARVHFEWVWDGATLYIVQADEELTIQGLDPFEQYRKRTYDPVAFTPQALRSVSSDDAKRFAKIRNVFIYYKLKLPTAPLYILDDPKHISELSEGIVPPGVVSDLSALVKGSLVIRMDLATEDLGKRQLLPRTQEVRNQQEAIDWLKSQCQLLRKMNEPGAFLFHNFIPAVASAFAYAAPNEPVVQIEGLWGLPEGLYYNTHDKFVVDTRTPTLSTKANAEAKYGVRTKANHKRNFVAPNVDGRWETFSLCPPFDWRPSLTETECKYIAHHSRRIAEEQGVPVSIMWFIGVPAQMASQPMIPWYHERFDPKIGRASITSRTKTRFDRCFVVRTAQDVDTLRNTPKDQLRLRRIRVQPHEEALLRDKNTLKNIGNAAKSHDAVIVLEGAVLSHAYYQLLQTGAIVEVVHPFVGFEDRIVFNKLVRDKIPDIIKSRGERITTVTLNPESHLKALREKLVEEAYELLDARDLSSVTAELADVETVVQTLRKLYRIPKKQFDREIATKRKDRGGFDKGIVLLETENVLPTSKITVDGQLQLAGVEDESSPVGTVSSDELQRRTAVIDKRIDKHVSPGRVQITAAADIGVIRRAWEIQTKEDALAPGSQKIVSGSVKGEREGSEWKIEVAVEVRDSPPQLL